jgi:DNA-directed RNA polymerase specialized sigma24 family protein
LAADIRRPVRKGAQILRTAVTQTGVEPHQEGNVRLTLQRPSHKLQPDESAALVEAYKDGVSIKALGRQFNLHEQTARAHLERSGVVLRAQRALTDSQGAEVVELYAAGASLRQLGVKFGVANGSIRNHLLRKGVELRPARRLPRTPPRG